MLGSGKCFTLLLREYSPKVTFEDIQNVQWMLGLAYWPVFSTYAVLISILRLGLWEGLWQLYMTAFITLFQFNFIYFGYRIQPFSRSSPICLQVNETKKWIMSVMIMITIVNSKISCEILTFRKKHNWLSFAWKFLVYQIDLHIMHCLPLPTGQLARNGTRFAMDRGNSIVTPRWKTQGV